MTEDEAKKRKCFLRPDQQCLGSECMAWQWDRLHDPRERELWSISQNRRVVGTYTHDSEWRPKDPQEPLPPQPGSCGALSH